MGRPVVNRKVTMLRVRILIDMGYTYHNKISVENNLHYPYVCLGCRGNDNKCTHSYSYLCLRTWIYIQIKGARKFTYPYLCLGIQNQLFTYYIQYKGVISQHTKGTNTLTDIVGT